MALIITGVLDATLSGGVPKLVELYATDDIPDLSTYRLANFNNGGTSESGSIGFAGSATEGDFFYAVSSSTDASEIATWFGGALDNVVTGSGQAVNVNGDDAFQLLNDGIVVDAFGVVGTDGSGEPWEYLDGWAYRVNDTGPDMDFALANWTFSGTNALDGAGSNAGAGADAFPVGSYIASSAPMLTLNEIRHNQGGADDDEFFEVFSTDASASLSDIWIVGISGEFAPGQIDFAFDLSAGSFDSDGIFLLARDTLDTGTIDAGDLTTIPAALNLFGSPITYLLVEGFSGTEGDDLDTGNDGTLDSEPWTQVLDSVSFIDGDVNPDVNYSTVIVGPDGNFTFGGIAANPDGSDTYVELEFGDTSADTPGALNAPASGGATERFIHEIQGSTNLADETEIGTPGAADESPLLGDRVLVQGVVTQVLPDLGGFFVQEEDTDADGDAFSSEGIFVVSAESVDAGNLVSVEGTVAEVEGETRLSSTTVTVDDAGTGSLALVTATEIAFPTATVLTDSDGDFVANLEAYEGMLVSIPEALSVTELFQLDRFGTIRVSSEGRLEQFTQSNAPSVAGFEQHLKDIAARSLIFDDGSDVQNPNPILVPDLGLDGTLDAGDGFRMGDTYTNTVGVLGFSEDDQSSSEEPEYRIHQPETTLTQVNPRPATPEAVGSDYTVASLNVLNLFSTLDEFPSVGEGSGPNALPPRGADANPQEALPGTGVTDEYSRQLSKLVEQIVILDADVIGLVELENDFLSGGAAPTGTGTVIGSGVAISELVDGVNAAVGAGTYAFVDPGAEFVGGDAIAVGFIYDTTTTSLVGEAQILEEFGGESFLDPNDFGTGRNRAALAQTFEEIDSGETFTVAVNHFKSKGASGLDEDEDGIPDDPTNVDSDQFDGQGYWNATRTDAARILADWLATDPTGSGDPDILIIGDLNAYQNEEPITTLEAAGFTDLANQFVPNSYSFVFDGQQGALDYALANSTLLGQVTGATEWHANADEADVFDYNLEFGRQPELFTLETDTNLADNPFRASDHDPLIVGLDLGSDTGGGGGGITPTSSTLELFHIADQEATGSAIVDAPNLSAVLNALVAEDLGDDGVDDNTLILSSGDMFIPGPFFSASAGAFGSEGIADILIQNELGIQASALGNHEFDFGTGTLADLIDGSAPGTDQTGADFVGTTFPYLSANLDFSTDTNLAPLAVSGGNAPQAGSVSSSVVIDVNGENVGVVGATTPTLDDIASPDGVTIFPTIFDSTPTSGQIDALAAEIQDEVDALLTVNPEVEKVILLAHMQQISIELALAERLEDVDIIVAGGSNTRLFDDNDVPRSGDSDQGQYPTFVTNAGGSQTAVVNTDGSYTYVGRLVLDFDENGNIIPESYDEVVSGAYATDAAGVAALGAEGLVDPEIQAIVDAIEAEIQATEGNIFGISDVFLNGNRSGTFTADDPDGVRTQETNLGNLTADANLAAAQAVDSSTVVSIKNGGGIRANIGEVVVPPGGTAAIRQPNSEILDGSGDVVRPEGGISQSDIESTLAFNNGLTLLTLTAEELVAVLEHGVSTAGVSAGRFPQVSGVRFSFDDTNPANDRIQNAVIFNEETEEVIAELVRDGEVVDPSATYRIVTLDFLADGGDSYPFPTGAAADRVELDAAGTTTGTATFSVDGSEQDALAEYLAANFGDAGSSFNEADTGPADDERIQDLRFRSDTILMDTTEDSEGNNSLSGGDSDDTFDIEGGVDSITTGAGADVVNLAPSVGNGSRDLAVINDFDVENDVLAGITADDVVRAFSARGVTILFLEDNDRVILFGVDSIDDVTFGA